MSVSGASPRVGINGRFLGMPVTGVQRYAHELVRRLPEALGADVHLLHPCHDDAVVVPGQPLPPGSPTHGGKGHLWEQAVLPVRLRRSPADLLFSPCNWGPLAVRRQVVMLHDAGPLLHPELFTPNYVRWARLTLPPLARIVCGIVTSCERTKAELCGRLAVPEDRVAVVPPGVGPTLRSVEPRPPGDYCLFVGGDDSRKNLQFLLAFWPEVHRRLGLTLRVVARAGTTTRKRDPWSGTAGVTTVNDPSDGDLARLYAGALCLLWPSWYEGYGLPLLESMAAGTPFISTDTGAAAELAVDPGQVLPLEPSRWIEQLATWRGDGGEPLREASREAASAYTWSRSTERLADALRRVDHPDLG